MDYTVPKGKSQGDQAVGSNVTPPPWGTDEGGGGAGTPLPQQVP